MEIVEETPMNNMIVELKSHKRSNSSRVNSSGSKSGTKKISDTSQASSQDSLHNISSTENIIENAKKSLKNLKFTRPETINNPLLGSTPESLDSKKDKIYELRQMVNEPSSPKKVTDRLVWNCNKSSNESIVDKLKSNNDSETSMTTASIQNFCSFLASSSSNNSSTEKLNRPDKQKDIFNQETSKSVKQVTPTPIYDNFTLPENEHKQAEGFNKKVIDKSNSAPESFVCKLNKKQNENKSYIKNKMSLADKDPEAEIFFIKSKLRQIDRNENNNSRSVEELNALNLKISTSVDAELENIKLKKLCYSKSMKLKEEAFTKPSLHMNPTKVVLVSRNENTQSNNMKEISNRNDLPLRKVSERIKDLNGPKMPAEPVWKDLALKKKNAW